MHALRDHHTKTIPRIDPDLALLRHAARHLRLSHQGLCAHTPPAQIILLLQGLTGKRLIFLAPQSAEQSFDERWIVALLGAIRRADAMSYRFLLRSRMSVERASAAHFPLCALAPRLDKLSQNATFGVSQQTPAKDNDPDDFDQGIPNDTSRNRSEPLRP